MPRGPDAVLFFQGGDVYGIDPERGGRSGQPRGGAPKPGGEGAFRVRGRREGQGLGGVAALAPARRSCRCTVAPGVQPGAFGPGESRPPHHRCSGSAARAQPESASPRALGDRAGGGQGGRRALRRHGQASRCFRPPVYGIAARGRAERELHGCAQSFCGIREADSRPAPAAARRVDLSRDPDRGLVGRHPVSVDVRRPHV